jgi:ribosome-associated heat shock protein Hsp15
VTAKALDDAGPAAGVRLDIWLWAARFFKTRALAKQAIEAGRVEVNAQACKPAKLVRAGDRIDLSRAQERYEIDVLALSSMRGPAPQAQQLYSESAESQARRNAGREQRRLANAGYSSPPTKPDKHARRKLQDAKSTLPPWWPK